jgi:hypothetical protein
MTFDGLFANCFGLFEHHRSHEQGSVMTLLRGLFSFTVLVLCLEICLNAEDVQFLPEVDARVNLNEKVRFTFQAKGTREGGDPIQAEIGPSVDFYVKPLLDLKKLVLFDLDQSKARVLVLSIGYRYLPMSNAPATNRIEPVAIINFPLKNKVHVSDLNRFDLDWSNGGFQWRYRNKLTLQRSVKIRSMRITPYASVEPFYESRYQKWSSTEIAAGVEFPINKHVELTPYYQHENNTGKTPNQQVEAVGLILSLYFR